MTPKNQSKKYNWIAFVLAVVVVAVLAVLRINSALHGVNSKAAEDFSQQYTVSLNHTVITGYQQLAVTVTNIATTACKQNTISIDRGGIVPLGCQLVSLRVANTQGQTVNSPSPLKVGESLAAFGANFKIISTTSSTVTILVTASGQPPVPTTLTLSGKKVNSSNQAFTTPGATVSIGSRTFGPSVANFNLDLYPGGYTVTSSSPANFDVRYCVRQTEALCDSLPLDQYQLGTTATVSAGQFITWKYLSSQGTPPPPATGKAPSIDTIRSVTYWDPDAKLGCTDQFNTELTAQLNNQQNGIPAAGLNTVWVIPWWHCFQSQALPTPQYNEAAFTRLRSLLAVLKQKNMRVILPLDYIDPANYPAGLTDDGCGWIGKSNPSVHPKYDIFEAYVAEFLRRTQDYSDIIYPMLFTEGTDSGSVACPGPRQTHAQYIAQLQATIGGLPGRLPSALRSNFRIGYHDFSTVNAGNGNPIGSPNTYDFMSLNHYDYDGKVSDQEYISGIQTKMARFRALWPTLPVLIGESGTTYCEPSADHQGRTGEAHQAGLIRATVSYAKNNGYGFNLWQWRNTGPCGTKGQYGWDVLDLTTANGTWRPAASAIKSLLNP